MSRNRFLDPEVTLKKYQDREALRERPLFGRVAALYERVSGDRQAKEASIETQDDYLHQYCDQHGIRIYDVYQDNPARSEVPMAERREGHRLIEDAKQACFDLVLVHDIERWSRYQVVYKEAQQTMLKLGIDLDCPGEHLSWDSPGEAFSSDVRLRSSQLMRDIIEAKCTDGKYSWASKGAGLGAAPHFGYAKVPAPEWGKNRTRCVIDEPEAEIIRRIFDLLVRQQMSARQIAAALNAENVPLPTQSPKWDTFRKHPSALACQGKWSASRISQICRDRLYTGSCLYGGTEKRRPVLRTVPAIIDPERFAAAQRQLTLNLKRSPRNAKRAYLLSGKLHCETCQAAYTGVTENNGTKARAKGWKARPVYRCQGYQRQFDQPPDPCCCPFPRIPAVVIEADLWQATVNYVERYEERLQQLREAWAGDTRARDQLTRERDNLLRRLRQTEEEILAALRGKSRLAFDLTVDQARAILTEADAEKQQLTSQLADLERALQAVTHHQGHLETAEEYLDRYRRNLRGIEDPTLKKEIIEVFLEGAFISRGEAGECVARYRFYAQDPVPGCTPITKATTRRSVCNWCVDVVHSLPDWRGRLALAGLLNR